MKKIAIQKNFKNSRNRHYFLKKGRFFRLLNRFF
jgi:hypothetical protein